MTAIDVGYSSEIMVGGLTQLTDISASNPANGSGLINYICVRGSFTDLKVGSFYHEGSNVLSTRDYVSLGNVEGPNLTVFNAPGDFTAFNIEEGDYIGYSFSDGSGQYNSTFGAGLWYLSTDVIPCSSTTFSYATPYAISLYATGETTGEWQGKILEVGSSDIAKICGIPIANISKVMGISIIGDDGAGNDRGVFISGYTPASNTIDYITISTTGNAIDFGDLISARYATSATSNGANDRGVSCGGYTTTYINNIEYFPISTPTNSIDFGDLFNQMYYTASCSNGINDRGVTGGGMNNSPTRVNIIQYITISTPGNATDYCDLTTKKYSLSATSNGINNRAIFAGGSEEGGATNIIEYMTITSSSNSQDFGDLTSGKSELAATSNGTSDRGVFGGGGGGVNIIDYITITSTSNAANFGDLTNYTRLLSATSNTTNDRGVFGGGYAATNVMDYITISTTSNAEDFGDLTVARGMISATSNC